MEEYLGCFNVERKEYEKRANEYAEQNGLEIVSSIGKGQWGIAFVTTAGEVIKVTGDPLETYNSLQLINKDLDNVCKIYDVDIGERLSVIKQELISETNTQYIKEMFESTERKLRHSDQCFVSLDWNTINKGNINFTYSEERMANQIHNAINNMYDNQGKPEDISDTNIGINSKGDFVIFDQRSSVDDTQEIILKLEQYKTDRSKIHNAKPNNKFKIK